MREALKIWGLRRTFSNKETVEKLGIEFKDVSKSIPEMAEQLIQIGYIPEKRKNKDNQVVNK